MVRHYAIYYCGFVYLYDKHKLRYKKDKVKSHIISDLTILLNNKFFFQLKKSTFKKPVRNYYFLNQYRYNNNKGMIRSYKDNESVPKFC